MSAEEPAWYRLGAMFFNHPKSTRQAEPFALGFGDTTLQDDSPRQPSAHFEVDSSPPTSKILNPSRFATMRTNFEVRGTAFSSSQADHVRCIVRRKADGMYFDGTSSKVIGHLSTVQLRQTGTWSVQVELDPGEYFVATYAIDQIWNSRELTAS